jgi:hypothetical protein
VELDQKKILLFGGAGVVAIVLLSKLAGKSSDGAAQPAPQISNIGPSGTEVNDRYTIQAQSQLAQMNAKQAGLESLLNYSSSQKTLDTQYALGIADLTNTFAIRNKELDTSVTINKENVESQNLQAQLASTTALGVAGLQLQGQMAEIGGQVQIASIAAGVQSERTKADVTLGLRGYDSADYAVASNEKLGLAAIDLEKFGITTGADVTKYGIDLQRFLGKKSIKADVQKAEIGAQRDITLSQNQTNAQIQLAKIARPKWYESLLGGLGGIGQLLTGGGGLFPGGF